MAHTHTLIYSLEEPFEKNCGAFRVVNAITLVEHGVLNVAPKDVSQILCTSILSTYPRHYYYTMYFFPSSITTHTTLFIQHRVTLLASSQTTPCQSLTYYAQACTHTHTHVSCDCNSTRHFRSRSRWTLTMGCLRTMTQPQGMLGVPVGDSPGRRC